MFTVFDDEYFMQQAFLEAQKAFGKGEVPVGAVVVSGKHIIGKAHNQTELLRDVTAHAEILAITAASEFSGSKYLDECTLYVTLEPCTMCAGALAWAQLGKLVYGATDKKRGYLRFGNELLHPKTTIAYGILEQECSSLLTQFFAERR